MKTYIHVGAALALTSIASAQLRPTFAKAQFRVDLSQQVRPGEAVLELRALEARGGRVRLELEDRIFTEFRDDGGEMDQRPFDGIFTGVVRTDLQEERAIARRLEEAASRGVEIPIFDGRELVARVNSRHLVKPASPMAIPVHVHSASTTVVEDHSLMIIDPTVFADLNHSFNPCTGVGNPDGAWAFGHVMTELAGTHDPSVFAMDWLSNWGAPQTVNGHTSPARVATMNKILSVWDPGGTGVLDMDAAPFHPIAIVLRLDLRETNGYSSGSAGEARIIYSFVDENCQAGPDGFLAIFEYAINKTGCDVRQWGQDWADLSDLALGSTAYNDALAALTTQFTDLTSSPNANELGQLRTNELLPGFAADWQLREFRLDSSGLLEQVSVKLTPPNNENGGTIVTTIMNGGGPALSSIEGASSEVPFPPSNVFWVGNSPVLTDNRHKFSLNTCNGCHGGEVGTFFTHVNWTVPGVAPTLSPFLTGILMPDAAGSGVVRPFNDLERRRQDLQNLIDGSCFGGILHEPAAFTH